MTLVLSESKRGDYKAGPDGERDEGITSYAIRDRLGRLQESDQFEGTGSLVATCTTQDALGNALFVTVPFLTGGSPACPSRCISTMR